MEYFDILDKNGNKTGIIKTREEVHTYGYYHGGVIVLVLDENNNLLLQKRTMNKDSNPGKWDISCAGHLDVGEDFKNAAIRELHEELGININTNQLYELSFIHLNYSTTFHNKIFIENELDKVFICSIKHNTNFNLQKEEVDCIKWIPSNHIKTFLNENVHCIDEQIINLLYNYLQSKMR